MTPIISIESILESQAEVSTHMAVHLESLASHYGQMAGALRENEAGEIFNEEDLQGRSQVHLDVEFVSTIYLWKTWIEIQMSCPP